jgi:hypothetical protein
MEIKAITQQLERHIENFVGHVRVLVSDSKFPSPLAVKTMSAGSSTLMEP